MVTTDELRARVESDYARLDLPSWPNPYPEDREPPEEDYSRLTEPERYRIVHLRARVWSDVLREVLGASVEVLPDPVMGEKGRQFDRGWRISPAGPGMLSLLLLEDETDEGLSVLGISAHRPELAIESFPDCGCDACDWGSASLLEGIDDAIVSVVGGPFVLLEGPTWHSRWHPEGASGGGPGGSQPDFEDLMAWSRRLAAGEEVALPAGVETIIGRSWLR